MTIVLAGHALTTVDAVQEALGISGSASLLARLINEASAFVEAECNRKFARATVSAEKAVGRGGKRLFVKRCPLVSITSIYYGDDLEDSGDYEVDGDGGTGAIYHLYGQWVDTACELPTIGRDLLPGSERSHYSITYVGGYVLPKDAAAASIVGTNAENFTVGTDIVLTFTTDLGSTATSIPASGSPYTAAAIKALIDAAIVAGGLGDVTCSAAGGVITLTTVGKDQSNYIQVSAGAAATLLGIDTDAAYGTRTLPWDLEQLCISLVVSEYLRRSDDKGVKSESVLTGSQSYFDGGMNSRQTAVLRRYTRIAQA